MRRRVTVSLVTLS